MSAERPRVSVSTAVGGSNAKGGPTRHEGHGISSLLAVAEILEDKHLCGVLSQCAAECHSHHAATPFGETFRDQLTINVHLAVYRISALTTILLCCSEAPLCFEEAGEFGMHKQAGKNNG